MSKLTVIHGDCLAKLRELQAESVQCCVTSPPYWGLRDYGHAGQIGMEATYPEYVAKMVAVFAEVRRALRNDGTLWLNLGDSYNAYNGGAGPSSSLSRGAQTTERPQLETGFGLRSKELKPKDLVGIPWRVAFGLQADGWYLRSDIIWHKPNPMPESVTDRPTKAHEYIFLLSKSERYFYDAAAIAEPSEYPDDNRKARQKIDDYRAMSGENGQIRACINPNGAKTYPTRNRRTVWTVTTQGYEGAHFATYPTELIRPCILAGSRIGDMVLDPFGGSGTTGEVALGLSRDCTLIELNGDYLPLIAERTGTSEGHLALHV